MQRHREHQHRRPRQMTLRPFCFLGIHVQMRDRMVKQQQKRHPDPKADDRRQKRPAAHRFALIQRRDQKAPDRSRHHDPGGKSRETSLYAAVHLPLHEKDTRCAKRRSQKWDQ